MTPAESILLAVGLPLAGAAVGLWAWCWMERCLDEALDEYRRLRDTDELREGR